MKKTMLNSWVKSMILTTIRSLPCKITFSQSGLAQRELERKPYEDSRRSTLLVVTLATAITFNAASTVGWPGKRCGLPVLCGPSWATLRVNLNLEKGALMASNVLNNTHRYTVVWNTFTGRVPERKEWQRKRFRSVERSTRPYAPNMQQAAFDWQLSTRTGMHWYTSIDQRTSDKGVDAPWVWFAHQQLSSCGSGSWSGRTDWVAIMAAYPVDV